MRSHGKEVLQASHARDPRPDPHKIPVLPSAKRPNPLSQRLSKGTP